MFRKLFLIFIIVPHLLSAQTNPEGKLGNWWMYFGTHQINDKFSIHYETQLRNYEILNNFFQLLPRAGLNYHIDESTVLTAGYAWIPTQTTMGDGWNDELVIENRIWQQFILKNKVNNLKFRHRYRLEQRWIKTPIPNSLITVPDKNTTYKNRARYMLSVRIPLKNDPDFPLFISLYDEIFLNISDQPFDQNRLFGALGIQVNDNMNIQVGYLRHRLGAQKLNRLQFAVFLNTGKKEE